jgi:hypothetical protein
MRLSLFATAFCYWQCACPTSALCSGKRRRRMLSRHNGAKVMGTIADHEGPPVEDPHAALERALIAEFLDSMGQTQLSIEALPPDQQRALLRVAAAYATLKLSEIEARARYVNEIEARR